MRSLIILMIWLSICLTLSLDTPYLSAICCMLIFFTGSNELIVILKNRSIYEIKRLLSIYCTLDENGTATDEGVTIFSTGEELSGHREASEKLDFAMAAVGDEVDLDLDWQPLEE